MNVLSDGFLRSLNKWSVSYYWWFFLKIRRGKKMFLNQGKWATMSTATANLTRSRMCRRTRPMTTCITQTRDKPMGNHCLGYKMFCVKSNEIHLALKTWKWKHTKSLSFEKGNVDLWNIFDSWSEIFSDHDSYNNVHPSLCVLDWKSLCYIWKECNICKESFR